ncbi:MAG: cobalamin-dependent protein [Corallococcus sp.]|nr:cobalamin-dependent protein [Corallococcus sp.]
MVWLVDCTTYSKKIDPLLDEYREKYFVVKGYKRMQKIGKTAPTPTKTYSNGLLRIATLLKQNGVECEYIHSETLAQRLDSGAQLPQVVAFSTVCPTIPLAAKFAEQIKVISPETKVFAGGPHVNNAPRKTAAKFPIFDKLTVGLEEDAASAIAGKKITKYQDYIDFSLLPDKLSDYAVNTFSTIGCPFSCGYCADGRTPKIYVADDCLLTKMKGLLPPRKLVHVFDSVFGYSAERAFEICKVLQEARHGFLLSCDMRAEMVSPKLLREMQKAGFVEIRLGIESADEELLRGNGRTLAPSRCLEAVRIVRECSDLYVTLYSVTGLAGTTADSHRRTMDMFADLLINCKVDEIKNALYVPYPYDDSDYESQGITIVDDDWSHYDRQSYPVFKTDLLTREQLWQLYVDTAKCLADSWLEGLGFDSYDQVPDTSDYYGEYAHDKYALKNNKESTI